MEDLVMPILLGFGSGIASGFIQFWTQLKDENNDGITNWEDFDPLKFGKTVLVSGIAGGYFGGTGLIINPSMLVFVSMGSEKIIGVFIKFLKQVYKKFFG